MWSVVPESVVMPSFVSWMFSLSRVALNPASQNFTMDRRGCCSADKTSHFRADMGSWGNGSRAVYFATMVSPLGMPTCFPPYRTGTLLFHGQAVGRKWLVHPDSATSSSKGGVTRV